MRNATDMDPAIREKLRVAAVSLRVDRVTTQVVAALNDEQVPSILLKGPSIARWLYPTGGRRYGDTDLLSVESTSSERWRR